MPTVYYVCPTCSTRLKTPRAVSPGRSIRCPRCRVRFAAPPAGKVAVVPDEAAVPISDAGGHPFLWGLAGVGMLALAALVVVGILAATGAFRGPAPAPSEAGASTPPPPAAPAPPLYPHTRAALHELREARKEIEDADFGGRRERKEQALRSLDDASEATRDILHVMGVRPDFDPGHENRDEISRDYKSHPHLWHSIRELKAARDELKEGGPEFAHERERAIHKLDEAVDRLEEMSKDVH